MMMLGGRDWLFQQEARKPRAVSETLARFWSYFAHYRFVLAAVVVLVVITTFLQVEIPILMGQAVDCFLAPVAANCWYTTVDPLASEGGRLAALGGLVLLISAMFVVSALLSGLQVYLMMYTGQNVLRTLRIQAFAHIHRLSLGYYSKHEAGDVMSRITNDADAIQQAIGWPLVGVVSGVLLIGWIAFSMLSTNIVLALVALSVTPLMFIATLWLSNEARKAFRRVRRTVGDVNASLQENLSAVREAQAFSRESQNIESFSESNAASRDASIRAVAYTSALQPTLEALGFVAVALVAGVGGWLLLTGATPFGSTISLGVIVTFIAFTQRFNQPIAQISAMWGNLQSGIAGGERIFGFIDTVPDLVDAPDATEMPLIAGRVEFDAVSAEYEPGQPVLRDVDLVAEPGQMVAIVGPTGAGKTTLVNLIPRFYDVSGGSVRIDGIDVRTVTARSLRSQIGMVLQDSFLFSDSVLNNIRYGRPSATDEEVRAAARLARAETFIERLPTGYETVLGERGSGLSLGQRQLLAIARAALADPRILILDEATSSVDTRTERLIQDALEKLLSGRTSFVIAHRLSTIRHADQVLAIRDGEIIERGTHAQLLARRGYYYELYMSQFRRDIDFIENGVPHEAVQASDTAR